MSSKLRVYVKAFPIFKDFVEMDLPYGSKLSDLVKLMIREYSEFRENYANDNGSLDVDVVVMINNRMVKDVNYNLKDGDKIYFIPPVAGGL